MRRLLLAFLLVAFGLSGTRGFAHGNGFDFVENKGQWEHDIRFKTDLPSGTLFMTSSGFMYHFVHAKDFEDYQNRLEHQLPPKKDGLRLHAYKVNFVGGNSPEMVTNQGFDKRSYYYNYIMGADPSKWKGHVGVYGKGQMNQIYDGVDVVVYSQGAEGQNQELRYDFIVAEGKDADVIKLSFDGVKPTLDKEGNLVIKTSVNKIIDEAPYCFQIIDNEKVEVPSRYVLENGILSFAFPEGYNKSYPLIIDPNLVFATYSGKMGGATYAHSTTFDEDGRTYASGLASSATSNWPVTTGAYQVTATGTYNATINAYTPNGSALVYSTYFGAAGGSTEPNTMRVGPDGNLVIAGSTDAFPFPTTTNAYQANPAGGNDIFVSKLSADGSTLLASTLVGGSGNDASLIGLTSANTGLGGAGKGNPIEITFDSVGNVWVGSNSASPNFPVTTNALQGTLGGSHDAVLFQLDPDFTMLMYSTFIGGNGWDGILGLEFDPDGYLVAVGTTSSTNFPTSAGSLNPNAQGGEDGFVTRINPITGARMQSTYLGTTSSDIAQRIDFDCSGNVYVAGMSTSGTYPVSSGAHSDPGGGVFIQKLSSDLSTSIASTVVGATGSVNCAAFMIDYCGQAVVGTIGGSPNNNPGLTNDAWQVNSAPFYFAALSSDLSNLEYGSFYGISGDHYHPSVARLDKNGVFYQSVCNAGAGYPTTPNAFSPVRTPQNSSNDVITFKFDFDVALVKLEEISGGGGNEHLAHTIRGCKSAFFELKRSRPDTADLVIEYLLSGNAQNGVDYAQLSGTAVIPAGDTMTRVEVKPLLVPNMPTGPRQVTMEVLSPCSCDGGRDNVIAVGTVEILDSLFNEIITPPQAICAGDEIEISAQIDTTLDYYWDPLSLIPDPRPLGLSIHPTPSATATYSITVTQPGAPTTCPPHKVSYTVIVDPIPNIVLPFNDKTICINPADSFDIAVYALPEGVDYSYKWTPATGLRNATDRINRFSAAPGTYTFNVEATSPNAGCKGDKDLTIHVAPPFHFDAIYPQDTVIKYGQEVRLNAVGDAISWVWFPVTYLDEPTLKEPLSRPKESIVYQVVGMDKLGCRDTGIARIRVIYEPEFFIPTAFSPNGDGLNDVFKVENIHYERIVAFDIYNRLGQLVFTTKNNNNGWDGRFNGKAAPADTYFYRIKVQMPDGENKTIKGDITLVR